MDVEIYETYVEDLNGKRKTAFKNITSKPKIKISNRKEKIIIMNMYDEMISYQEFVNLDLSDQAKHLLEYRKQHTCVEIAEFWSVKKGIVYDLNKRLKSFSNRKELDAIIKAPRQVKEKATTEPEPKKKSQKPIIEPKKIEEVKTKEVKSIMDIKPVLITVNKTLSGEHLKEYILKLLSLFEEDNNIKFQMSINLLSNKFKFSISVDDVFIVKDLIDYLLGLISGIPKTENYTFSVLIEELETKPTEQTPIENKLVIPD